ncbi:MAG: hypothetical protein JOY99_01800 [Sphingomonadaceae bacterium]|nr:hypothetical protein [Sphingomonadaceae bacterium]
MSLIALYLALQASVVARSAPPVAATASPATPAKPKLICEEDDETGTRLGNHKVCMTADQWRAARVQAREEMANWQRGTGACGLNCGR